MRPSLFILISYFLFLISPAVAQNTFTARIVDAESGDPLPLVSIYISEEKGTLTNFDGEFSIMADSTDLLRITCVGRQSIALYASQLPQVLRMKMLSATLSEVTVSAVEGKLLEVARRMEKAYGRRKYKEAQYFYRQTSVLAQKQDIVEAFIGAKAAVNLRGLEFLTGRHGRLSEAAWAQSAINEMNLHHVLELGPMTKDAAFWHSLVTPLPAREPSTSWGGFVGKELGRAIEYLQKHYIITIDEMDGEDQQLYRIQLRRREDETMKAPIMTGTLYVDRPTLSVLAFDGQVENMIIRFGKGELRSATTIPVNLEFHIDYRYDRKFPEVADLSMQARWGDFQTRTLLFNVEGQKHLKKKKGTHARENMLTSIATVGYDSTFWANNEVVKRTAEEAAIAAGTVDRQQARLDSVATAQAAMPPLERLADRLTRFGQAIPQEKVYVHMDNTCYFLGDTIWFAAYTRRTNEDKPSRISRVLYAELWNHDGYLVERKLVEMKEGRGRGFFALPDTLYSGYFELRAYTRWQLNWGQTEHYHTWPTEYWFYNKAMAKDFFRDYEKLYSRVFPVYDKPKQKGEFYRDMTLRPLRRYFKSAPKPAELRLSLFPEGGNLVAGVPCRVAFEAATSEGEVVEGSVSLQMKKGKIKMKNERGEEVESVETENRGRGTFIFTPEEGEKYEVVFTAHDPGTNGKRETVSQTIKDVKAEGVALQANLDSLTGQWNVTLYAAGQAARQPLGLTVMHEGQVKFFECIVHSAEVHSAEVHSAEVHSAEVHSDTFADGNLESQQSLCTMHSSTMHFCTMHSSTMHSSTMHSSTMHSSTMHSSTMHSTSLSPGIHQVTVFDSIGHIYADRLFFVTAPDLAQPTLMLSGLKDQYQPYEQVNLDITSSHLMPGQTVSLAVRDAALQDYTFDSGNIMTEMLLASEIKGFVPQPDYFFEADDAEHRRALDLLMLTQGWRRFNWQDMAVKGAWDITHPAEHTQMVTGTVNRYYADTSGFDPNYDAVQAEHAAFQMSMATNLFGETVQMGDGSAIVYGNDGYQPYNHFANNRSYGNRNFGWNLNPFEENKMQNGYFGSSSSFSSFQLQRPEWRNTDYNVLNFKTADSYRQRRKDKMNEAARRYVEEGTVKKDVTVHAEFVDAEDPKDYLIGETQTQNGRFQIDLPRFEGQCIFFLAASDTTKWKKKERHNWVKVDPTDEYSSSPAYPEYYVRLNFPYPRWVKPYTFYQVHNALIEPLPSRSDSSLSIVPSPRSVRGGTSAASPAASKRRLLTDGTNLLSEVTIRARHGGLRRIDYSKPAYVIDAYNALNLGMDAGLIDYTFSAHEVGQKAAAALIGDMGMERHYDISTSGDSRPGLNRGPLEERRYNLLPYIDKMYIYTDYSPRREGDERYEQDNQPSVRIDLRRYPDQSQRVTYIDRRYILPGFAYQEDFYHPDYQRTPPTEATKDYRRTLYWNPDLQLDANGRAHIHFFTGTRAATLHVDAAGQTAAGDLLFCQ